MLLTILSLILFFKYVYPRSFKELPANISFCIQCYDVCLDTNSYLLNLSTRFNCGPDGVGFYSYEYLLFSLDASTVQNLI